MKVFSPGCPTRASLTVEAALIFPLMLLILVAFLQMGFFLSAHLLLRLEEEKAILYYKELREKGKVVEQARIMAESYFRDRINLYPLKQVQLSFSVSDNLMEEKVRVGLSAEFGFLFPRELFLEKTEVYMEAVAFRDTLVLAKEAGEQIPVVRDIWEKYRTYLEKWTKELGQK